MYVQALQFSQILIQLSLRNPVSETKSAVSNFTGSTPDRGQSKMLLTIDERR